MKKQEHFESADIGSQHSDFIHGFHFHFHFPFYSKHSSMASHGVVVMRDSVSHDVQLSYSQFVVVTSQQLLIDS